LNWTDFLIFVLVRRHVTVRLTVFHLQQTNSASYEMSTGSPADGLFILINIYYLVFLSASS